jgi:hypothetical protein
MESMKAVGDFLEAIGQPWSDGRFQQAHLLVSTWREHRSWSATNYMPVSFMYGENQFTVSVEGLAGDDGELPHDSFDTRFQRFRLKRGNLGTRLVVCGGDQEGRKYRVRVFAKEG